MLKTVQILRRAINILSGKAQSTSERRKIKTKIDGKRLVFNVELWDEGEKVGKAVHERFIVDMNKLLKKIDKKKEEYCKQ